MIFNQHTRILPGSLSKIGGYLDDFGSPSDAIWPRQGWPRARLEGALAVGTRGRHGPIRYVVEQYTPGRAVKFRFTGPRGFVGHHDFLVEAVDGEHTRLTHTIQVRASGWAYFQWHLAIRALHDALLEDLLDRASLACGENRETPYSLYVKLLKWGMARTPRGAFGAAPVV